ncbi:MAG: hypothetical protein HOO06_07215 [Bdellovibrionaceae bacterium]|jgi:hypothetical protein|nr:hypothetical protein [Pseudobdellovibrionaceae bacterium]
MLGYRIINCNGSDCSTEFYNDCFELWHTVWSDTLLEVAQLENMSSDQFLVNDNAGVITWNEKPISLFLFNQMNMSYLTNYRRSYILNYPQEILEKASEEHSSIFTFSNLTVHPNFRKSNPFLKLSISALQFASACKIYELSKSTLLLAITRNSKNVHRLAEDHGATTLQSNLPLFTNEPSDCIAIYKDKLKQSSNDNILTHVNHWFNEKLDIPLKIAM